MNHYLYEIRNKLNDKIYVGVRSCHCEIDKDRYMGSGKVIRQAIKIYGRENFEKKILQTFTDRETLYLKETEVVNSQFINRSDTYNMALGGCGGRLMEVNPNLDKKRSVETRKRMSDSAKNRSWTKEGLKSRIESTRRMTQNRSHPDFSGDKNPAARKIQAEGMIFNTGRECASHFKIKPSTVIYRIKSNKKGWTYVE